MSNGNYGFWAFNGTNGLKGAASKIEVLPDGRRVIVKNASNPAVLEDEFILYSIQHVPQARSDFNRLFPSLLPEEQERLNNLIELNPRLSLPEIDSQTYNDMVLARAMDQGIHVRMPKPNDRIPGRPRWWRPFPA